MKLRSGLALRRLIIPAVVLVGALGIARATDPVTPGTTAKEDARAKTRHLPVTTLRDRMLEAYHGQATDLFTSIPGFGMERLVPMYKYVPFEVPDLSTNEVEVEKAPAIPELLKDVFAKSRDTFRDPSKPLPKSDKAGTSPFGDHPRLGGRFRDAIVRGVQLRMLDLVGLINDKGPQVYSGGKAFEVMRMSAEEAKKAREAKTAAELLKIKEIYGEIGPWTPPPVRPLDVKLGTRPLDVFETAGVAELSDGKDLFIRTRGNVIRMLGALRATETCTECHTDRKKGDLLGAFSYTFVDTGNALAKELNPEAKK